MHRPTAVEPLERRRLLSGAFRLVPVDVNASAPEGSPADFTVERVGDAGAASTVRFSTADLTALADSDYTPASLTLQFAPGQVSQDVSVATADDEWDEADETFRVTLSDPTGGDTLGDPSALDVTILDEDAPPVGQVMDASVAESQGTVRLTVTVPGGDLPVTLGYATADGTAVAGADYTPVGGTLAFPASREARTQVVTVPLADDAFWEESEWFYLELGNGTNVELPGGGATYRATVTVRDNDPRPVLVVSNARADEGDSADTQAVFTVTLAAAYDRRITVDYATAGQSATSGVDFTPATGTLVFEPGETSKAMAVAVRGDTAPEGNETFALVLSNPVNTTIQFGTGTGTIVEDDDRTPVGSVVAFKPVLPEQPVDFVSVSFDEPVSGFDLADLVLTRDGVAVALSPGPALTPVSPGQTWTLTNLSSVTRPAGQYVLTLRNGGSGITDLAGNALVTDASDNWRTSSAVAGRRVFYNNSSFDGNSAAADARDDAAVAPDKQALLPGQSRVASNYTSYVRGLNGLMVDVAGLPPGDALGAEDFGLKVGNDSDPSGWAAAPAPQSVTVRRGAGVNGSDRVTLVFADGAIRDQWLQVSVRTNARTGLAADDVFYFGNLTGETNDNPSSATVNALDLAAVKRVLGSTGVGAGNAFDFDRDGRVNALDLAAVKGRLGRTLALNTAPALASASADAAVASVVRLLLDERASVPAFSNQRISA